MTSLVWVSPGGMRRRTGFIPARRRAGIRGVRHDLGADTPVVY
jgi:hypothetical protein